MFQLRNFLPLNAEPSIIFCRLTRVGFTFPTALLTYTHGNNVGSLHFVWRVETFGDGAFSDSQPVIELKRVLYNFIITKKMTEIKPKNIFEKNKQNEMKG